MTTPREPHLPAPPPRRPGNLRRAGTGTALVVIGVVLGTALAGCSGGSDESTGAAAVGNSQSAAEPAPGPVLDGSAGGAGVGGAADSAASGGSQAGGGGSARGSAGGEAGTRAGTEMKSAADAPQALAARPGTDVKTSGATGSLLTPAGDGSRRVRTADQTVRVTDLRAAVTRVRTVATGLGGVVGSESTALDGSGSATVVLRVPEPKLDQALDQVAGIGKELRRSTTSEDVSAVLADLDSRVASQRSSVARVRALMDRATRLQDVVLLEGELSRRESELEAAQARRRALSDQADLATATVQLQTGRSTPAPAKDDDGFVAGLRDGWHALAASTRVVVTVIGAALPVALVLAVVAVPGYLVWRRRRTATP